MTAQQTIAMINPATVAFRMAPRQLGGAQKPKSKVYCNQSTIPSGSMTRRFSLPRIYGALRPCEIFAKRTSHIPHFGQSWLIRCTRLAAAQRRFLFLVYIEKVQGTRLHKNGGPAYGPNRIKHEPYYDPTMTARLSQDQKNTAREWYCSRARS